MAIRKPLQSLHTLLTTLNETQPDTTITELLNDPKVIKLFTASKGGFNGTDSFVTIDGQKVARVCAMTGAIFAHDNTDKSKSFFYKNGSYMIGAEVVKANSRKEWEATNQADEQALEDQMLEGEITPSEWKEQRTAIKTREFNFTLDEDTKQSLIEDFDGIVIANDDESYTLAKAEFTARFNEDDIAPFTDYEDEIKSLREQ